MNPSARFGLCALVCFVLTACGGGGGGGGGASFNASALNISSGINTGNVTPGGMPATLGKTVYVGSMTVTTAADAIQVAQLADVPWNTLPPGSRVLVAPGTYRGPVTIVATGSDAAPIVIQPSDPTRLPVISDSVDLQGSSFVRISGLLVQAPNFGGFVIRKGSHDVTIDGNTIRNAPTGVDIADGAGLGLVISNNLIEDAATNGISVGINGSASLMNAIRGNTIRRSGHHGIELQGSYWRVEGNDISGSGQAIGGTSGIHVYSASATEDSGDYNLIRYNLSHENSDTSASDGNGIQIDHWCDNNTVAFNIVWANDGPGINIFEAVANKVYSNTSMGNSLDRAATHGALAEIVLAGTSAINRTAQNQVFDNIAVGTRPTVPGVYVDGRAFANPNTVGPNLQYNMAGGVIFRWGDSVILSNGALIDAATHTAGNLVEMPAFSNPASPATGGLSLLHSPSLHGKVLSGETDIAGVGAQPGFAFFGAYFIAP